MHKVVCFFYYVYIWVQNINVFSCLCMQEWADIQNCVIIKFQKKKEQEQISTSYQKNNQV